MGLPYYTVSYLRVESVPLKIIPIFLVLGIISDSVDDE